MVRPDPQLTPHPCSEQGGGLAPTRPLRCPVSFTQSPELNCLVALDLHDEVVLLYPETLPPDHEKLLPSLVPGVRPVTLTSPDRRPIPPS